jgi:hypothetical protein
MKYQSHIIYYRFMITLLFVILWIAVLTIRAETGLRTMELPQQHKEKLPSDAASVPLSNALVPLSNSVYALLEVYEASGLAGFLPQSRPYTKGMIAGYLNLLLENSSLTEKEKEVIRRHYDDLVTPDDGVVFKQHEGKNSRSLLGAAAQITGRAGLGDRGTWSVSNIAEPFIAGDMGRHISYFAGIGLSVERLAPGLFYQSYVKNGRVHFPYEKIGYAFPPYGFSYETMWNHVKTDATTGGGPPVQDHLTAGMLYHTELSGVWLDGALQLHLHNHHRSRGYSTDNLILSGRTRRFPGLDFIVTPAPWLRYSFMTGSLFSYANQASSYKSGIYGYDLGHPQKILSLHLIEVQLSEHFQLSFTGGNIWSKRFEPAYLMPFVLPHLTQIDIGDHDNPTMGLGLAVLYPKTGKSWFSLFIDEFSFTDKGPLLRMPRNRYAWQLGWDTPLLRQFLPLTMANMCYTRVTPFVYTHYPENDFVPFNSGRPVDMTYSHDEAGLGFYLPPNSAELKIVITHLGIPDVTLSLDHRFIVHGTNDLAGDTCRIFGDIYRHQLGDVTAYPLLDFGNDGIYDYTWSSELRAEKRVRRSGNRYFRITGSLGYSHTWWKSNNSGVQNPGKRSLLTGSVGIITDF